MVGGNHDAVLNVRRLPARINADQTAMLLGFSADDLTILMRVGHLQPLGRPAPNAPKYFSSLEVLKLAEDRVWLDKGTRMLGSYWKKKRERKSGTGLASAAAGSRSIRSGFGLETPSTKSSTKPSLTEH